MRALACDDGLDGQQAEAKPATVAATKPDQSARLKQVLDELSVNWLKMSPEFATSLAVSEAQAGGRYLDRLSDDSTVGMKADANLENNTQTALHAIDRTSLWPTIKSRTTSSPPPCRTISRACASRSGFRA